MVSIACRASMSRSFSHGLGLIHTDNVDFLLLRLVLIFVIVIDVVSSGAT